MRLYARPGWRMARQLAGDVGLLLWWVLWAVVGHWLVGVVDELAVPARQSARTASDLAQQMAGASDKVSGVPAVGSELSHPFDSLASGLNDVVAQANQQAVTIHHLAVVAGWLCFLVPSLVALVRWVPERVRFVRLASATRRVVDADEDLELFALRAMATAPMPRIARITDDPVGDWRAGNQPVVRALAELELERLGLQLPRELRGRAASVDRTPQP